MSDIALAAAPGEDVPRLIGTSHERADVVYRLVVRAAAFTSLAVMGLIGAFLLIRSSPALREAGFGFLTTFQWTPEADPARFGVAALAFGTLVTAVIAMAFAVPLSIATALFITQYAPRSLSRSLTSMVDLFAAVPSLIYGMWGLVFLNPLLYDPVDFLTSKLGFIPLFAADDRAIGNSLFIAGFVVSLMVMPITTSIMREVFSQAPRSEVEGALALGATRWGVVRTVILPFGRGGIIGGSMLGLGRAMGETIAVALVLNILLDISPRIFQSGGTSIASHIALTFPESGPFGVRALMGAGLVLFVITLAVNLLASAVVARSRSGQGIEI